MTVKQEVPVSANTQETKDPNIKRCLIRTFLFLAVGLLILLVLQDVVKPEYRWPDWDYGAEDTLREFYDLEKSGDCQVLFLGTSHIQEGIDPMEIYARTGIISYNLASSAQPITTSYYLLEEALNKTSPKLIILDVNKLFSNYFEDSHFRFVMDEMRMGKSKLQLAWAYARNYEKDKRLGALLGAFFPIYRYHDRWKELDNSDFQFRDLRNLYRKGYLNISLVSPDWIDENAMNTYADMLHQDGRAYRFTEDNELEEITLEALYMPEIDDDAAAVVLNMKALCEEHGAELKLIKIPSVQSVVHYGSAWTKIRSDLVKQFASDNQIDFIDLQYDIKIPVDWSTDTNDEGIHLNSLGAWKVSDWLADYLKNDCGLKPDYNKRYEEDLPIFYAVSDLISLQTTDDLSDYLAHLSNRKNTAILMAANNSLFGSMTERELSALTAQGLRTDFSQARPDAYAAVIEDGKVCYEAYSDWKVSGDGSISEMPWEIESRGWLTNGYASISLDGCTYEESDPGLLLVVMDSESGTVLDSVLFNPGAGICHRSDVENHLREYEQYLMQQDYARGIR